MQQNENCYSYSSGAYYRCDLKRTDTEPTEIDFDRSFRIYIEDIVVRGAHLNVCVDSESDLEGIDFYNDRYGEFVQPWKLTHEDQGLECYHSIARSTTRTYISLKSDEPVTMNVYRETYDGDDWQFRLLMAMAFLFFVPIFFKKEIKSCFRSREEDYAEQPLPKLFGCFPNPITCCNVPLSAWVTFMFFWTDVGSDIYICTEIWNDFRVINFDIEFPISSTVFVGLPFFLCLIASLCKCSKQPMMVGLGLAEILEYAQPPNENAVEAEEGGEIEAEAPVQANQANEKTEGDVDKVEVEAEAPANEKTEGKLLIALVYIPLEDLPQLVIQLTYLVTEGREVEPMQVFSVLLTILGLLLKIPDQVPEGYEWLVLCLRAFILVGLLSVFGFIAWLNSFNHPCPVKVCGGN